MSTLQMELIETVQEIEAEVDVELNESLLNKSDQNILVTRSRYQDDVTRLLVGTEEKEIILNKAACEISIQVISAANKKYDEKIDHLQNQINSIEVKFTQIMKELQTDKFECNQLEKRIAKSAQLMDIANDSVTKLVNHTQAYIKRVNDLSAKLNKVSKLENDNKNLQSEIAELRKTSNKPEENPKKQYLLELMEENNCLKQKLQLKREYNELQQMLDVKRTEWKDALKKNREERDLRLKHKLEEKQCMQNKLQEVQVELDLVQKCQSMNEKLKQLDISYINAVIQKNQLENELTESRNVHISLNEAKYNALIKNLTQQNLLQQAENQYEHQKTQNEYLNEKLEKLRNDLLQESNKDLDNTRLLKDAHDLFEKSETVFADEIKQLQIDHDANVLELSKRNEYSITSKDFLKNKLAHGEERLASLKETVEIAVIKQNANKVALSAEKEKIQLQSYKNKGVGKSGVTEKDHNIGGPAGILKSRKEFLTPKTPPKKVKFEGLSSTESVDTISTPGASVPNMEEYAVEQFLKTYKSDVSKLAGAKKRKMDF